MILSVLLLQICQRRQSNNNNRGGGGGTPDMGTMFRMLIGMMANGGGDGNGNGGSPSPDDMFGWERRN